MKSFAVVLGILICVQAPALAAETASQQAERALELWNPSSVDLNSSGNLVIVLPQRRITATIFRAVMTAGICGAGVIAHRSRFPGVRQISVLNQFGAQGYVFEGGAGECQ